MAAIISWFNKPKNPFGLLCVRISTYALTPYPGCPQGIRAAVAEQKGSSNALWAFGLITRSLRKNDAHHRRIPPTKSHPMQSDEKIHLRPHGLQLEIPDARQGAVQACLVLPIPASTDRFALPIMRTRSESHEGGPEQWPGALADA